MCVCVCVCTHFAPRQSHTVAISEDARVTRPACAMLAALGSVPGACARLVRANAVRAVSSLVGSEHMVSSAGLYKYAELCCSAAEYPFLEAAAVSSSLVRSEHSRYLLITNQPNAPPRTSS